MIVSDGPVGGEDRFRYIGVGCVTVVAGAVSGTMIAVLIAKLVGDARGCRPTPGLPACDWHVYAFVGMLLGAITLPFLALRSLRRRDATASDSQRG